MAFLFGVKPKTKDEQPAIANIQIQTASYGKPIPIVFGQQRVPANVIWYDEFTSQKKKEEVGKGGAETTSYEYSACVMLAVCEGPIVGWYRIYRDKDVNAAPADQGFEADDFGDRTNPTPWSHLSSVHPTKAIPYAGTAWIAAAKLDLPNAQLRNHSLEVIGFNSLYPSPDYTDPRGYSPRNGNDAHPTDIILGLFTNEDWGLGQPSSRLEFVNGLDGTANSGYNKYCHAMGFYISVVLVEQVEALTALQRMLDATNTAAVWSQGKLKFIPYGDASVTGNGYTYTPYLTAAYALGRDDYIPVQDGEPIQITRKNLQDAYNSVPVQYSDRTQDYKDMIQEDPDQADVEASGLRRSDPVDLMFITRADMALQVSRLMAQRNVYIRNTYKFKLPQRYALLEPMDLVTLTEETLGLDGKLVRITSITEDSDCCFEIEAEEVMAGSASSILYVGQSNDGTTVDAGADPGNANTPVIFIPTYQMTNGFLELWLATNGGPAWGGAEVWVSEDDITYQKAGEVGRCTYGTITSGISNSATTIPVQLVAQSEALESTSADGAADDLSAMWLEGGEVFSYETATLTGTNAYSLTGCLRGRLSTSATSHSNGDDVVRLNDALFKVGIANSRLGKMVYIKLASFNTLGGGRQDISTLTPYTFAIPGNPSVLPVPTITTVTIQDTDP